MSEITMRRVCVSPDLAAEWLKRNPKNRRMRDTRVRKFARDMANGDWMETHQAIAFNCDGTLRDGQHRLAAIVESQTPQTFWVAENLGEQAVLHIDTHAPRSDADAFAIAGRPVTKRTVAVAKQVWTGPRSLGGNRFILTRVELLNFIDKHAEALAFVEHLPTARGVCNAAILGAIARAYYHVNREVLERFARVLIKGPQEDHQPRDVTALRLRDVAITVAGGASGGAVKAELYRKTQTAIAAFAEGRALSKLYGTTADLFPLPNEHVAS